MKNTLDLFQRITNELLVDENKNSVAKHIPSSELFKTIDLSLKKDPIAEDEFEKVVTMLCLSPVGEVVDGIPFPLYLTLASWFLVRCWVSLVDLRY